MQEYDIVNITEIIRGSADYPKVFEFKRHTKLKPPEAIYSVGDVGPMHKGTRLGVVGSRHATIYGSDVVRRIVEPCSAAGAIVVSGLALGIDTLAHQAALSAGTPTIAVLPGSLDLVYPASHEHIARRIVASGGLLISEHKGPYKPYHYDFVLRNRLIAALSDVLLVIEAGENSGSIHTIKYAQKLGKPVVAVPGDITKPLSYVPNRLILEGKPAITTVEDLLPQIGFNEMVIKTNLRSENPNEQILLDLLAERPHNTAELASRSKLEAATYNICVTMLEIRGDVIYKNGKLQINKS